MFIFWLMILFALNYLDCLFFFLIFNLFWIFVYLWDLSRITKGAFCYSNTITKFTTTFLSLINILLCVAFLLDRRLTLSQWNPLSYRNQSTSQWTGFYMIGTFVMKGLNISLLEQPEQDLRNKCIRNIFSKSTHDHSW